MDEILALSHVAVKVSDLEKSLAFYRDFLGYEEQYRLYYPQDLSLMLVALKVNDDQFLELFDGGKLGSEENPVYQIAFRVRDAQRLRSRLADQGVRVPASVGKGQTGNLGFTIRDPNGYNIEFTEYCEGSWTLRDKGKFLPPTRISDTMTHAGVVVFSDYETTRQFYVDLLGFVETWRGSPTPDALSWVHTRVPGGTDFVELMLSTTVDPHFCLVVDDVAEALKTLEARPGARQYPHPMLLRTGINRKRQLNLFDPDGVRVELMERRTVDGSVAPPSSAPIVPGKG